METARRFAIILTCAASLLRTAAAAEPVTKDLAGADHPLLKRYEGSFIAVYSQKEYDEYKLVVGKALNKYVPESGGRQIEKEQPVEGKVTRITYFAPKGRSVLEAFRNYDQELKAKNAETLFAGSGKDGLGYDFGSLPQYNDIDGQLFGYSHTDARYGAYKVGDSYVAIYVAAFENGATHHTIENGQTAVQADIIEAKPMQEKMVTVDAGEMDKQISATGKVALYGIYFDFNNADVKPESEPTLAEIGKLMQSKPGLKILVVGHTDAVGGFESNKTLSQKRAESVVASLSSGHGIDSKRLFPVGVSFAAPVATNTTDQGRAKNRRVELVEMQGTH